MKSECIEFDGEINVHGYGRFQVNGVRHLAHRWFWMQRNGYIPDGLQINHHCDNRRCVNPDHLYAGTHSDNMRDKVKRRRHHTHGQTLCKHGHPLDAIDNTAGKRYCKTCKKLRTRAWRAQ